MQEVINTARETLLNEGQAILKQIELLNGDFLKAVELIIAAHSKLVVTGMGKSGIIGHKIAATMASTGTPSVFMHPGEAYHGDLGMVRSGDAILALSFSGETDEILRLIPFFKDNNNPVISITGNSESNLAKNSDVHLHIAVEREACPLHLAPTTSTTVTLAMGDALAMALMKLNHFKEENFARFHPGGSLGKRLLAKVETVMRTADLPLVSLNSGLPEIISAMSKGKLGLALVNDAKKTIGIITDGDLRRLMETVGKEAFDLKANEIMSVNPKKIIMHTKLSEAEQLFLEYKINSLIVIDEDGNTIGVIQIYDLNK